MATVNSSRRKTVSVPSGYSDDTGPRIQAYLAQLQPLRGIDAGDTDEYRNAISAISRLAASAAGTDSPTYQFTQEQAADVLLFMRLSEPVDPVTWWTDPKDAPSHVCGWELVLQAVEDALRA